MKYIKEGDIVGRISYGKDILFKVEKIIQNKESNFYSKDSKIVLLKGLTIRIKADSPIDDLVLINKDEIKYNLNVLENKISSRIENSSKRIKRVYKYGRILHLDGDYRYTQKSIKYYKKMGIDAIVKNVIESKQPVVVRGLLQKYKPDILVVTRS